MFIWSQYESDKWRLLHTVVACVYTYQGRARTEKTRVSYLDIFYCINSIDALWISCHLSSVYIDIELLLMGLIIFLPSIMIKRDNYP